MDILPTHQTADGSGFVGNTLNKREEPVYKNTKDFLALDVVDEYPVRRMKAVQVSNLDLGGDYERAFESIPSRFPRPDGTEYSHFDGVLIPKKDNPETAADFDAYVSPASHFEITTVVKGKRPELWPDPSLALFNLVYVKDVATGRRLLITDFRRPTEGKAQIEQEAILKIFKPSFFFLRVNEENHFGAPKFEND